MELVLTPLEEVREKTFEDRLFEDHVEEPRVFAALVNNKQVGWIELGFHNWNNRMRVWEFLVEEEFRRRGIGTLLMKHAVKIAKEKGARMLVLETQTCNVPAISFYLKFGFELIGFDATAYSNEDIEKKEVRLELGLRL
jgi:ribosomal protein S18 acetylase RimI-like enzyme